MPILDQAPDKTVRANLGEGLPDFDDPPVIETVLDVAFDPLPNWGIRHFGLFWQSIKAEYPYSQDQPPIILQRETFGTEEKRSLAFSVEITQQPEVRCWFVDKSQSRLIQVQRDRFVHNWRQIPGQGSYPRYEQAVRPGFSSVWTRFREFLDAQSITPPVVQQCEVQYINHIALEGGWQNFANVVDALESWPGAKSESWLPLPESIVVNTSYLMPNASGRLRIIMQPAIRNLDGKAVIQLTMVARGRPKSSETSDILNWFDLGREWVVKGFVDFTSKKMHQIWKRRI